MGRSLFVRELCHPPNFLRIIAAIPVRRKFTGLSVLYRGLRFHLFSDFWLAWSTSLPVLSFQHVYLTQLLKRNLSHTDLRVFVHRVHRQVKTLPEEWDRPIGYKNSHCRHYFGVFPRNCRFLAFTKRGKRWKGRERREGGERG